MKSKPPRKKSKKNDDIIMFEDENGDLPFGYRSEEAKE
jgi:hypothetical protein